MTMDFEELKAYTKKATVDGESLYDHLTSLLLRLNKEMPEDAIKELQALSVKVKKSSLKQSLYRELNQRPAQSALKKNVLKSINDVRDLYKTLPKVTDADRTAVEEYLRQMVIVMEEEEEGAKEAARELLPSVMKGPHIPNIMGHASLLEWGGVNIGREEMYKVNLSLRRLTQTVEGLISVRFFGKIFGTAADYYVVEAKKPADKKAKEDPITKKEATGFGANEFVYYASNSLEGKWEELPDVLPEQIITSRSMRRFFSGDLRAPVKGYPRFPWPEASYLRAQIARIGASTIISPRGLFVMTEDPNNEDEDAPEIMEEDPEFEPLALDEFVTAEGWVHHRQWIYKQGRTKKWEAPENEDEEEAPEDEEEEEEEEEEEVPRLNGLENDDEGAFPLWKFTTAGGQHAVVTATSLQWPGAVTVGKDKNFCNIYLGWGQEYLPVVYTPPALPAVASEYVSGFNPEEAEEDETDPMVEQIDPLPPKDLDGDEGDEGDEDDDEEE